jgi:hypothetical protein
MNERKGFLEKKGYWIEIEMRWKRHFFGFLENF